MYPLLYFSSLRPGLHRDHAAATVAVRVLEEVVVDGNVGEATQAVSPLVVLGLELEWPSCVGELSRNIEFLEVLEFHEAPGAVPEL